MGSNLVLKVKRRRVPAPTHSVVMESEGSAGDVKGVQYEYSADLIGICNKTYQFLGVCIVPHVFSMNT